MEIAINAPALLPLFDPAHPLGVVAWRGTTPVGPQQFLNDVQVLARRLPAAQYALNLCEDRYHFMIAFAAACLRGQTNLLPPSHAPGVLEEIAQAYPGAYALGDAPHPETRLPWVEVRAVAASNNVPQVVPSVSANHIAALVFTSGSTGAPQPHAKSWGGLVRTAQLTAERLLGPGHGGAHLVATVPPQHMYGLETAVMLVLAGGCAAHTGRPLLPAELRETLAQVPAPRVLVTTPVHLRACLALPAPFAAVQLVISATAPLSARAAAAAQSALDAPVHEIYGCTEAGTLATRHTVTMDRWELLPGIALSRQNGKDFAHVQHLPAPVELPDALEDLGGGRFRLLGRNADLLKVGGKRASLADLTARLLAIPGVQDAVVFMPPDSERGAVRPAALVVAPDLDGPQILRALEAVVDPVFLPRPIICVPRLPRNTVGKLPRSALLAELERRRTPVSSGD